MQVLDRLFLRKAYTLGYPFLGLECMKFITKILTPFLVFFSTSVKATHPAIIKEEFLFNRPLTASCHAATIAQTRSGSLLCAWFGGSDEGENDVSIYLSSRTGSNWNPPKKVAEADGVPCWNPVLFTMPSNEVLLFYKAGKNPREWSGYLKRSLDEGITWSEEFCLPAGIIGPDKNKPLLLENNTLLCGSACESYKRWGAWIDITSDGGRTWTKSAPINAGKQLFGIIQPTLFVSEPGKIRLLTRSYQIGYICTATSCDNGKTWTDAEPISLPNPNAGIDAVRLQDSRILLIYNHSKHQRTPLNVAISTDGGITWEMKIVLEDAPGEYSYPSVIQTDDGLVHVIYTWKRNRIKHVVIDPTAF